MSRCNYPLAAGLNVSRPQGLRTSFGKVTVPTLFALCCWCFLKGKEKFDGQWFLAQMRNYQKIVKVKREKKGYVDDLKIIVYVLVGFH